jgi:ribonuclease HI
MKQEGGVGAGMILRDAEGMIVFSACRSLYHCGSALEAELGACMQSIALALQQTQDPIIVETDSTMLVKMILCKGRDIYSLGHLVAELGRCALVIRLSLSKFLVLKIRLVMP